MREYNCCRRRKGFTVQSAYDAIYKDIRKAIETGEYNYRDFLPSEGTLTKKYGCAHNTVRKALSILADEGYVQAIHGKGVRVLYHSSPSLTTNLHAYTNVGFEPHGFDPLSVHESEAITSEVLRIEDVAYTDEFATKTGFLPGGSCTLVERVHYIGEQPIEHEVSYLRANVATGITMAGASQPLTDYVESHGERLVTVKESFTVAKADERDRQLLRLADNESVVVIAQAFFDHDGLICKFSELKRVPSAFAFLHTRIRTKLT